MSDIANMALCQDILFESKNSADNVVWRGAVIGFVNYDIAKSIGDVLSYHTAVLKIDPTAGEITDLDYFIIKLQDTEEGHQPVRIFAKEWVEDGSFEILDQAVTTTIKIYDIGSDDLEEVQELLKLKGYVIETTTA